MGKQTCRADKFLTVVVLLFTGAFFASFLIINLFGFEKFCTADMYEDTYVARLMWEQKTVFPENWVFGNQYYVAATPVLSAVLYGISGSVNTAMGAAATVMAVLIVLSFIWMIRPFASWRDIWLGVLVLLAAVAAPHIVTEIDGQTLYLMASYYSIYLITYLVVIGDYLRILTGRRDKLPSVSFAVAMVLSFCTGMQSLRQTAIMIVPLCAYEVLRRITDIIRGKGKTRSSFSGMHTAHAAIITAANLLGCAVIRIISPAAHAMYGTLDINRGEALAAKLRDCLRALRGVSGISWLVSDERCVPIGILGAVLTLAVVAALFVFLLSKNRRDDGLMQALVISLMSIFLLLAVSAVIDVYLRRIYLFVWYPLTAVAVVIIACRLKPAPRTLAALLLCCSSPSPAATFCWGICLA